MKINEISCAEFKRERIDFNFLNIQLKPYKQVRQYAIQLTVKEKVNLVNQFTSLMKKSLSKESNDFITELLVEVSEYIQVQAVISNEIIGTLLLVLDTEQIQQINTSQIKFLHQLQQYFTFQMVVFLIANDLSLIQQIQNQLKQLNLPFQVFQNKGTILDFLMPFTYYFSANTIIYLTEPNNLKRIIDINKHTFNSIYNFIIVGQTNNIEEQDLKLNKNKIFVVTQQKMLEILNRIKQKSQYFPYLNGQKHIADLILK